jgi:hypothetical protein
MREYDEDYSRDYSRPYRPFLRRIIVLVVVITAVPVMLWTITAFVRSYVAQPKPPTFRPLAATASVEPPDRTAAATDAANSPASATGQQRLPDTVPVVEARATATDARIPVISFKKPSTDQSPKADAGAAADGARGASAADTPPTTGAIRTAATPTSAMAAQQPIAPPKAAAAIGADNTAWPDPQKSGNGPLAAAPAAAPATDQATDQAAADAVPPGEPMAGPIPLPRQRPRLFAFAQSGIPVPRPRPAAAAAEAAPSATGANPYWKLFEAH